MLAGKRIILGVTGGIAAYKAANLVRLLAKAGAEVQVLMTPSAMDFITPLTLSTLSKKEVFADVSSENGWNNHVDLGLWADVMVIAPATANTLAKLAAGICDNMIAACYLSARCPVFFAPAMDLDMWAHPSTTRNVATLLEYGNHLIPVGDGELASGLSGKGRMAEPEAIVRQINDFFQADSPLDKKRFLITAGPTYEPIDPVRFIGNRSSGKMGVAIAEALAAKGAFVHLILGPSKLSITHPQVQTHRVQTAAEMNEVTQRLFPAMDGAILAAAVADYRPKTIAQQKIKKKANDLSIALERTTDIAASLGKQKKTDQLLVGFALETNDELDNARGKLKRKNFDFIVLNSLNDKGAGFQHDTNKITLVYQDNKIEEFELKSKAEVAVDIVTAIIDKMNSFLR